MMVINTSYSMLGIYNLRMMLFYFLATCLCNFSITIDVNECLDKNGNCSHHCINTEGSYYCECPVGSNLQPNGHKCEGEW